MVATGLRVVVSEETIRFSQYDEVVDDAEDCALGCNLRQEFDGADVFIKAYTSGYNGGDGVTFAGCTLWAPADRPERHAVDVAWLTEVLLRERAVVVTHRQTEREGG